MPPAIPRTRYYIYKVYDSLTNRYLGNLPVSSDFAFSQDINTGGVQITIQCATSADTSILDTDDYTDESGTTYTDESGTYDYVTEGVEPLVGLGVSTSLIRDGNKVKVSEFNAFYPNGVCLFSGVIDRHTDNYGGDTGDNNVELIVYSDGSDLDDHVIKQGTTAFTVEQSQTNGFSNSGLSLFKSQDGNNWEFWGQTFTTGAGVTNLGAIGVKLYTTALGFSPFTANVTINVYSDASRSNLLGTVTQQVTVNHYNNSPVSSIPDTLFVFPMPVTTTPNTQYFFSVETDWPYPVQDPTYTYGDLSIAHDNFFPTAYAGGCQYTNQSTDGTDSGYSSAVPTPNQFSLCFKTYTTTGSTQRTFTGADPTTGILAGVMGDYLSEGGKIGIGNIQATGLSVTYGFNTNTTYEGVQDVLTLAPNGFYYYVDLGADLLYFQQANTGADFKLTKGVHINKLQIVSTTEYAVNYVLVVGGVDGSGNNVYTYDYDYESIRRYGIKLQIHTDSNILDNATAHAVGQSIIAENKVEQYLTTVTVLNNTIDVTQLTPGKILGFNGFGTYVDTLLSQIVHRDYTPETTTFQLGLIPKRTTNSVEQIVRGLVALNSINNPLSPS